MSSNPYETKRYVNDYLLFHYGKPDQLCPFKILDRRALNFHQEIVKRSILRLKFKESIRALDIGCAVGRFSFELGLVADSVVGVDYSAALIRAARKIQNDSRTSVLREDESGKYSKLTIDFPRHLRRAQVQFHRGDAQDLSPFAKDRYHIVAAINLVCRLYSPQKFIQQLPDLVLPSGQLILASPHSWSEDYTPKRFWLHTKKLDTLLSPHFRLAKRSDLPFMIREHQRKYQLVFSEVSTWIRRS